ncbi:MAG: hypothetical protein H7296_12650 [Bacteroidia bacterium]|nr:hypothetical protein [Bacteroidia bacterium]
MPLLFLSHGPGTGTYYPLYVTNDRIGVGTTNPISAFHIGNGGAFIMTRTSGNLFMEAKSVGSLRLPNDGFSSNNRGFFMSNGSKDFFSLTPISMILKGDFVIKDDNDDIQFRIYKDGLVRGREVKVDLSIILPDYVFSKNYELLPLNELSQFIKINRHLPTIPSAKEMKSNGGINLGEMQLLLLKKVEELTLYLIQLENEKEELKERGLHIRESALIILLVFVGCNTYSQNKYSYDIGTHLLVSDFGLNTKSDFYNTKWNQTKLTFQPKIGYGFSLGITRSITRKFSININARYQKWGGTINAIQNDPKYFLNLDITYNSVSVPISIQFRTINSNKLKVVTSFGFGMDFSYLVNFKPTNYYGTIPSIQRNINVISPFVDLGVFFEYTPNTNNRLSYIWGIRFSDDHIFNPPRFNDFGGYFQQNRIPLNSTIIGTYLSLRFSL